jgi:hypothetical protein
MNGDWGYYILGHRFTRFIWIEKIPLHKLYILTDM